MIPRSGLPPLRREALRDGLLACVDSLHRRRAGEIPEGYIEDYVSLDWLEWHGGSLRTTVVGDNVCRELSLRRAP